MDFHDAKRRIASGEGLTLSEAKEMLSIVEGEKIDLPRELQAGIPLAIRCVRNIMEMGESETAQIAAAKFWIEMTNSVVIADDGVIEVSFDVMDGHKQKVVETQAKVEK